MQEISKKAVEEFFVETFNVDRIFNSVKRADYLFLYYIEHCSKSSKHETGAYLWELAETMELSIKEISKAVSNLHDKGYVEWKTNAEKSKTYVELTATAVKLMDEERAYMKRCYDEIQNTVGWEEVARMAATMKRITGVLRECRAPKDEEMEAEA